MYNIKVQIVESLTNKYIKLKKNFKSCLIQQ